MTTRRRSTGRRRTGYARRRPRTRRRVSPAASLGTAIGVLVASLLISRFERFPWWVWILVLAVVVTAMALWAVHDRAAPPSDEAPTPPVPPTA